jgi:hypothetical protein
MMSPDGISMLQYMTRKESELAHFLWEGIILRLEDLDMTSVVVFTTFCYYCWNSLFSFFFLWYCGLNSGPQAF